MDSAAVSVKLSHWKSGLEVLGGSLDRASVSPKSGSMSVSASEADFDADTSNPHVSRDV